MASQLRRLIEVDFAPIATGSTCHPVIPYTRIRGRAHTREATLRTTCRTCRTIDCGTSSGRAQNVIAFYFISLPEVADQLFLHLASTVEGLLVGISDYEVEELKVRLRHLFGHCLPIQTLHHNIRNLGTNYGASRDVTLDPRDYECVSVGLIAGSLVWTGHSASRCNAYYGGTDGFHTHRTPIGLTETRLHIRFHTREQLASSHRPHPKVGPSPRQAPRRSRTPKNRSLQNFPRLICFNRPAPGFGRHNAAPDLTQSCRNWC